MSGGDGAPPLVLASSSPRRRDLLVDAGFRFEVIVPDVEENEDTTVPIRELTAENASLKAMAVARKRPDAVVVAADTLVLLGDRVLTKPVDRVEATEMLASLNGKTHQVFTAVSIVHDSTGRSESFTVTTEVRFRSLRREDMAEYHRLIDPMDKAGAYAAQDHGEKVIESIEGSMSNVIGLPIAETLRVLEERFGVCPE